MNALSFRLDQHGNAMRIGYPCINLSLECRSSKTFRLRSYSPERFAETLEGNLNCLLETLEYNREHGLLHFRISSDLVPFASHPVCRFDWAGHFRASFRRIGALVRESGMRCSMHPDQFTVINALDPEVVKRSAAELEYHAAVFDALELDRTHKIQIHVGGAYGNKDEALGRFIAQFAELPEAARRRLAVENDDRLFAVEDCLRIHSATGIPIVFDNFHHALNPGTLSVKEAVRRWAATWEDHGAPMADYSSQEPGKRAGSHAASIDAGDFTRFIGETQGYDFDVMLEIKDKEASALKALEMARDARRL